MNTKQTLTTRTIALLAGGLLGATALIGCGDDDGPALQPVEHQTANQALDANIQVAADDLTHALEYLRSDAKFGIATAIDGLEQGGQACISTIDPDDGSVTEDCEPMNSPTAEERLGEGADELAEALNRRVFTETNIEEETDTKITYLIGGESICADDDTTQESTDNCVANVNALQLRLAVTSPASGDIDIDVLVGEPRYNPLDIELHRSKIAAELDLGELLPTLELIGDISNAPLQDLPTLMQGRVRAELSHASDQAAARIDIQEKILVTGNDWSISAAAAAPAARIGLNTSTETLNALLNLKPVEIQAPFTRTEVAWDSNSGAETQTTTNFDILAQLAGASFDLEYKIGEDHVEIDNIGLGDAKSSLDIDANRVMEVDLNADDGRSLDVSIDAVGDNGADVTLSPGFDLELMLKFAAVQNKLDNLNDWMLDDVLRVALTGATAPKMRVQNGNFEILNGTLSMSSTAADIDVEVSAGQCLLQEDVLPTSATDDGTIEDEGAPFDDTEQSHPFSEFSAGTCE